MDVVDGGLCGFELGDVAVVSAALLLKASHPSADFHHRNLLGKCGPCQLDMREHLHGAWLLDVTKDGRDGELAPWSNEKMKVLWHDHIGQNVEVEPLARFAQGFQDAVCTYRIAEYR